MRFRAEGYDRIVFDCDGVLLDSNEVKSRAFYELARPDGEIAARRLLEHHQRHGGITRHEKLIWYVDEVLGAGPAERDRRIAELLSAFGEICRAELRSCATVPGVRRFLASLPSSVRCYVVSGGLESEVRDVLEHKGLGGYFERILGGPDSKRTNLRRLHSEGRLGGRGLYFGDARLDMELALEFGLHFVFVAGASEWRSAGEEWDGDRIEDFDELLEADRSGSRYVAP